MKPSEQLTWSSNGLRSSPKWTRAAALAVVVGAVEPVVSAVRAAAEPRMGHRPAYALGLLTAGAVALPRFAAVRWVFRREPSLDPARTQVTETS